jgi:hypothetical protein
LSDWVEYQRINGHRVNQCRGIAYACGIDYVRGSTQTEMRGMAKGEVLLIPNMISKRKTNWRDNKSTGDYIDNDVNQG